MFILKAIHSTFPKVIMYIDYPINLEIKKKGNIEIKGKHNKGIGL
jgi:hypothetical protein